MSPFTVVTSRLLASTLVEDDVSVGRLRRDLAARAGDPDAFVDRADVDAALGVLDDDLALDRLGGDEPRSALDDDVAAHGFGGDFVLRAFDADVEELPAHLHRQPGRRGDFVVDAARRAARRAGAHGDDVAGRLDVDR